MVFIHFLSDVLFAAVNQSTTYTIAQQSSLVYNIQLMMFGLSIGAIGLLFLVVMVVVRPPIYEAEKNKQGHYYY